MKRMKRLFWLAVGVTVGVLAMRRLSHAAQRFTPAGMAELLGGLGDAFRDFVDDVRAGMAERELELLAALEEHAKDRHSGTGPGMGRASTDGVG